MPIPKTAGAVAVLCVVLGLLGVEAQPAPTATLTAQVLDSRGRPLANAVVYLKPDRAVERADQTVSVSQKGRMFTPHVLPIQAGTTVRFPNDDDVYHNVFAYFEAKRFDLGLYPPGAEKTITFDKPGPVALFCNIHSNMNGYIFVAPTPHFAKTDKRGECTLRELPPGTRTVRVWHPAHQDGEQTVRLVVGQVAAVHLALRAR